MKLFAYNGVVYDVHLKVSSFDLTVEKIEEYDTGNAVKEGSTEWVMLSQMAKDDYIETETRNRQKMKEAWERDNA